MVFVSEAVSELSDSLRSGTSIVLDAKSALIIIKDASNRILISLFTFILYLMIHNIVIIVPRAKSLCQEKNC